MGTVRVRAATPVDLPAIARLGPLLIGQHHEADPDRFVGFAYAGTLDYDYVALRGPAGALYDIVVDPAHRGSGIGRMLLDAALSELAARGAPCVLLSTAEWNESAQRLFARAGFRRTMVEMMRELDRATAQTVRTTSVESIGASRAGSHPALHPPTTAPRQEA